MNVVKFILLFTDKILLTILNLKKLNEFDNVNVGQILVFSEEIVFIVDMLAFQLLDLGKIFLLLGDVEKKFINHEFLKCRFIAIQQHRKEGDFLESWVVCQINCLDGSQKNCEVNVFKRTIVCIQSTKVKIGQGILSLSKGSVEKNEFDYIIVPTDVEVSNCLWEGREIDCIDL